MTKLTVAEQNDLVWVKAAASVPGGYCVEVARHSDGVALRHSMRSDEGALFFSLAEFSAFLEGARAGEFDELLDLPVPRCTSSES